MKVAPAAGSGKAAVIRRRPLRHLPASRLSCWNRTPCEVLSSLVTSRMGKIRRGGFIFITWVGDHSPYHVHVYKDRQLVVKWDLENNVAMKGKATSKVLKLIEELRDEGDL